jgi:predicted ATPase
LLTLRDVSTAGYRSLQSISYPVGQLEVFVGANGVGKTNLYRGLELLHAAADNRLGFALAQERMASALFARPRRRGSPRIELGVTLAEEGRTPALYRYEVEVGYPSPVAGAFKREPEIKLETLSVTLGGRVVRLVERQGVSVMARGEDGRPAEIDIDLLGSETVLGRLQDPSRYSALDAVRRTLQQWRFYHGFRTDAASPLRRPCVAVATPTLASDGSDLAAVFATLAVVRGDTTELTGAVSRAFPGATLEISGEDEAFFGMRFPEFPHRIFSAAELSDGTLRFLALAGALLGYRLPPFVALNEPEASLHPDLMPALADLIVRASRRSQIWLVTHSEHLADLVASAPGAERRIVFKKDGATWIEGLKLFSAYEDDDD